MRGRSRSRPRSPSRRRNASTGPRRRARRRVCAALFALAAGIGLTLGYALDLVHAAWAAAAAMFIMRPDHERRRGRGDDRRPRQPLVRDARRIGAPRPPPRAWQARDAFEVSFVERLLETALGAALALLFGVATPALLRARSRAAS